MEDDPRHFEVPAPGRVFFAGWIVAIVLALVATAGLVLAREYWIGRQMSDLEREQGTDFKIPGRNIETMGKISPIVKVSTDLPVLVAIVHDEEVAGQVAAFASFTAGGLALQEKCLGKLAFSANLEGSEIFVPFTVRRIGL